VALISAKHFRPSDGGKKIPQSNRGEKQLLSFKATIAWVLYGIPWPENGSFPTWTKQTNKSSNLKPIPQTLILYLQRQRVVG
jgi:hypothetical protein